MAGTSPVPPELQVGCEVIYRDPRDSRDYRAYIHELNGHNERLVSVLLFFPDHKRLRRWVLVEHVRPAKTLEC